MRYDKKTDELKLLIQADGGVSSKTLDEDVTIAYAQDGNVAEISINNALQRIFEGLGIKMPSERKTSAEEAGGGLTVEVDVGQVPRLRELRNRISRRLQVRRAAGQRCFPKQGQA